MKASTGKPDEMVEAASAAMQADVARTRLNLRSVGHLPLDRADAARKLKGEQRALPTRALSLEPIPIGVPSRRRAR